MLGRRLRGWTSQLKGHKRTFTSILKLSSHHAVNTENKGGKDKLCFGGKGGGSFVNRGSFIGRSSTPARGPGHTAVPPRLLFLLCCGWGQRDEEGTGLRRPVPGVGSFGGTGLSSNPKLRRPIFCIGRTQRDVWDASVHFSELVRALRTYSHPPQLAVLRFPVGCESSGR